MVRPDGEVVALRKSQNGRWLCPVCAVELRGEAPYDDEARFGSQDICRSCNTQFGADDAVYGAATLQGRWKELRIKWIVEMKWSQELLNRLRDGLNVDPDLLRKDAEEYQRTRQNDDRS
jgi:hypothetical protein